MEKYVVLRRERQQNHYFVEASISTLNAAVGEGPFLALLIGPFPTQQNDRGFDAFTILNDILSDLRLFDDSSPKSLFYYTNLFRRFQDESSCSGKAVCFWQK